MRRKSLLQTVAVLLLVPTMAMTACSSEDDGIIDKVDGAKDTQNNSSQMEPIVTYDVTYMYNDGSG